MSQQGNQVTAGWDEVTAGVKTFVTMAQPLIIAAEAAFPGGAVAIDIGSKLLTAALNEEPAAKALVDRIMGGGTPVTPAELAGYITDRKAAFAAMNTAIDNRIAELSAPPG